MKRENQQVEVAISEDFQSVTFQAIGHPAIVLDMTKLHPDIIRRAACAGMAQVRIVDAAAVSVADDEGNIIPVNERLEMKHNRMEVLVAHYMSGTSEWSRRGEGTGGAKSITIEAIANLKYNGDYEKAKTEIDAYAARKQIERKKALSNLKSEAVLTEMARLRSVRMPKAKIDADAALSELAA